MKVRGPYGTATALLFACTILSACSSTDTEAACTPDDEWVAVPSDWSAELIAERLSVEPAQAAAGTFGPATCDKQLSQDAIGTGNGPIVSVDDRGSRCITVGVQTRPVPGASTDRVIAICPQE